MVPETPSRVDDRAENSCPRKISSSASGAPMAIDGNTSRNSQRLVGDVEHRLLDEARRARLRRLAVGARRVLREVDAEHQRRAA